MGGDRPSQAVAIDAWSADQRGLGKAALVGVVAVAEHLLAASPNIRRGDLLVGGCGSGCNTVPCGEETKLVSIVPAPVSCCGTAAIFSVL